MEQDWYEELYAGLRALAASAFPKICVNCGRRFATVDDFLRETERGLRRREHFGQVLNYLEKTGLPQERVRQELRKIIRGKK